MFFFNDTMGFGPETTWDSSYYDLWRGGASGGTPVYNSGSDEGGSWWDDWGSQVINQAFGIGSQVIGAWGRNPTQQVGAGGTPIGQGYSPAAIISGMNQQQQLSNQQISLKEQSRQTNSLDAIFGSITNTISSNPMIFLGLGVGLFLLFRDPPRRR